MRTQKELSSFIVLRSNGWSLARISKHLNVPKTTLFRWEEKNAQTIHLLKYVQLEKIQEQYVPSYEEQLKDTHEHLEKIRAALKQKDYSLMSPEFLLQMNFQLQTRLDKIRQQVPLRSPQFSTPIEALPAVGCVTKDEDFPGEGDFSDPDPNVEGEPPLEPAEAEAPSPQSVAASRESAADQCTDNEPLATEAPVRKNPIIHPPVAPKLREGGSIHPAVNNNSHANGNAYVNGNGHHRNGSNCVDPCLSVVDVDAQNGTFRNENPRGSKIDPCKSTTSNHQNGTTVPFRKETHE